MIYIRQAKPEDAEQLLQVHTQAIRETAGAYYSQEQIEAWAGGLVLEGYIDAMAGHPFLVAEDEQGSVIGFGELNFDLSVVCAVYVLPDSARRGAGRKLLHALEEIARAAGVVELRLDSSVNAELFYNACGYESGERTLHPLRGRQSEIACVKMRKRLQ